MMLGGFLRAFYAYMDPIEAAASEVTKKGDNADRAAAEDEARRAERDDRALLSSEDGAAEAEGGEESGYGFAPCDDEASSYYEDEYYCEEDDEDYEYRSEEEEEEDLYEYEDEEEEEEGGGEVQDAEGGEEEERSAEDSCEAEEEEHFSEEEDAGSEDGDEEEVDDDRAVLRSEEESESRSEEADDLEEEVEISPLHGETTAGRVPGSKGAGGASLTGETIPAAVAGGDGRDECPACGRAAETEALGGRAGGEGVEDKVEEERVWTLADKFKTQENFWASIYKYEQCPRFGGSKKLKYCTFEGALKAGGVVVRRKDYNVETWLSMEETFAAECQNIAVQYHADAPGLEKADVEAEVSTGGKRKKNGLLGRPGKRARAAMEASNVEAAAMLLRAAVPGAEEVSKSPVRGGKRRRATTLEKLIHETEGTGVDLGPATVQVVLEPIAVPVALEIFQNVNLDLLHEVEGAKVVLKKNFRACKLAALSWEA